VTVILRIAVPSPLRQLFDYMPPAESAPALIERLRPGLRVRVPFGRRELIGVLLEILPDTDIAAAQLKAALEVLDDEPVLPAELLKLLMWSADYYHHALGECLSQALPADLRKGEPLLANEQRWRLTVAGKGLPEGALPRARQQSQALAVLLHEGSLAAADLPRFEIKREHLRALQEKGLVERFVATALDQPAALKNEVEAALQPSGEQAEAIRGVAAGLGAFGVFLLDGVTGSGKTEVYLQLLTEVIARGEQALVLIPEIGLSPQTCARFERRLAAPVAVLHSGLNDSERLAAWRRARSGQAGVVLGTRSAVFTGFRKLGLIIVDEEHDSSYKQQDGFRYSARDVAIKRAADSGIPIVLGSATPSLESLHNALSGRYRHLRLTERAGAAALPSIEIVDIRHAPMRDGLAPTVLSNIEATLSRGEQALVFLNRRGFAPTLLCHDCGWIAQCARCDARLTVHLGERRLICHHCTYLESLPGRCPQCKSSQLESRGPGTERLEQALTALFPQFPVIRVDRDTTQRKHAMRDKVAEIRQGQPSILVGTQMLAKGHHFPDVTLVVMVDLDGGLFSADLRGPERMGQVLTQVAGRAGRAQKSGRVLLQTHYPQHPLIEGLVRDDYQAFATRLLAERQLTGAPPFAYFALVRADAKTLHDAETLLGDLRSALESEATTCYGPLPAPMARRAGLFRAQLLLSAPQRAPLHRALDRLVRCAEQHPVGRRVKWSIDVDPVDFA
jgi:primosomal protein N' (replication factor Y) (superfamily II helicase)